MNAEDDRLFSALIVHSLPLLNRMFGFILLHIKMNYLQDAEKRLTILQLIKFTDLYVEMFYGLNPNLLFVFSYITKVS